MSIHVRHLKPITILIVTLLLLAGCAQIEISTTVKPDGSGTRRLIVAVDETTYELATLTGGDPFAEIRRQAQAAGAVVSPWQRPGWKGIAVSVDFDDLNALNSDLGVTGFEQVNMQRSGSPLQPTYEFQAHIDLNQLADRNLSDIGFGSTPDIIYILTMPGEIIKHNAGEVWAKNTVAWRFRAVGGGVYDLQATSRVDYSRYLPAAIAAVVGLAALALIVGIGVWVIRRS